jgi:phosphoribosyl-ATP pyrophosphohydrolase
MEEAFETTLELGRPAIDQTRLVSEAADLVYHLVVGLVGAGCSFTDVEAELARRRR